MEPNTALELHFFKSIKKNNSNWKKSMQRMLSQVDPKFKTALIAYHERVLEITHNIPEDKKDEILDFEYDKVSRSMDDIKSKSAIQKKAKLLDI